MKKLIILLFAVAFLVACSARLYEPAMITLPAGVKLDDLQKGRQIMADHCGKCHGMKNPSKFTKEKWAKVLDKMAPKAKLNQEQKSLVYLYVSNAPQLK